MSLQERGYSVLVVSASQRFRDTLAGCLPDAVYTPVLAASVSAAERETAQRTFDFLFVNCPLPDDDGVRFAMDSCQTGSTVAVLFVSADLYDQVQARAAAHGVYTLPKPIPRGAMLRALSWMTATRERLRSAEKKTRPIEEKMEEIRLVNRAKWLLISQRKMTEPDAHRYITRQAMDRCIAKRAVAEEIIRQYT